MIAIKDLQPCDVPADYNSSCDYLVDPIRSSCMIVSISNKETQCPLIVQLSLYLLA